MALVVNKNEGMGKALKVAVNGLKSGKIVVFPTESSYGLGCSIEFSERIKKIYHIKDRPLGKPLPVIVGSVDSIRDYAFLDSDTERLIKAFMPGPLTLVVKKKETVPSVLSGKGIAFRIPGNEFARRMALGVGWPVVSTSVNLSGKKPVYDLSKADAKILREVDIVIDFGKLPERMASTVFSVSERKILREGPIVLEEILKVLESGE